MCKVADFKSLVSVGWDFKLGTVSRVLINVEINAMAHLKDRSLVFDEE